MPISAGGQKQYVLDIEKIGHNIQTLRKQTQNSVIYAAVKANGYGTGCMKMAQVCARFGLRRFAATEAEEVLAVASSDIQWEEVLLMTSMRDPQWIARLAELGVTFTVASVEDAQLLENAPVPVKAHVKIDTGMGRRGFRVEDTEQILALYTQYPNIAFTGIYTHFCDSFDPKMTQLQFSRFRQVLSALEQAQIKPGIRHCCNSAGTFYHPEMILDGVRVGSAILGRLIGGQRFGLQRTGICRVAVESVRQLPKGATLGYGASYRTRKETKIALVPLGGHHGLGVSVRPGIQSLLVNVKDLLVILRNRLLGRDIPFGAVNGRRCPVLGCISSEAAVLDVTGVECAAGDVAEFDINPLMLCDVEAVYL